MDEIKKFIEALQMTPRAKELMDSMEVPDDDKKAVDAYIDLAKKLGFTFSREDFLNWVQEQEKERKARSEQAEFSMMEALDSEKLSMVAGGQDYRCSSTFVRGK